jgi:arginyl-tRNA synthetase
MYNNIIDDIRSVILNFLKRNNLIDTYFKFEINTNLDRSYYGDISTNLAMVLSKILKVSIDNIFADIKNELFNSYLCNYIEDISLKSGFINISLNLSAWSDLLKSIILNRMDFFKGNGSSLKYSIEFVSANPTGPLHIGHGRGAIIGDVLANILEFLSYNVVREFYINDAGSQIDKLGISFKIRVLQQLNKDIQLPDDAYHGEYLIDMAKEFIYSLKHKGIDNLNDYINKLDDNFYKDFAKDRLLSKIKDTLKDYKVNFDVWFSERELHKFNAISKVIDNLKDQGYTYQKDGALFFNSTKFFDDKDRVLQKNDRQYTYIAADIAYLKTKIDRAFDKIIMVLGQDHHGYINRLKSAMKALNNDPDKLNIIIYQLVTLKYNDEVVRMSKRSGKSVTLQDVIDTVGVDAARFFYLNKKSDAHLDFDINLALKHDDNNPLYYIQYAYVRAKSLIEKALDTFVDISFDDISSISNNEILLIKKIVNLKYILNNIASNYQVHLITYYLIELAQLFHNYYSLNRIIDLENPNISKSRLSLIYAIKDTFELGFDLIGISKPDKM